MLRSLLQADPPPLTEEQLRAAFIFHFAQYVEWPAGTFADDKAPFVVGVLGDEKVTSAVKQVLAGKSVNGRPLQVQALASATQATNGVQILFACASSDISLAEIPKLLQNTSVLTVVSEQSHFMGSGFVINLLKEGSKIHFQIDEKAAAGKPFKISSKLLSLASHRGQ